MTPSGTGLIPAHAGKTTPTDRRPNGARAHPRSRGENANRRLERKGHLGSSPLTRGKRPPPTDAPTERGLIPAHAGKTQTVVSSVRATWAHPRSRGENEAIEASDATNKGSSPLTRGKLSSIFLSVRRGRLIPAHAGKTHRTGLAGSWLSAHPRSRGENLIGAVRTLVVTGSSPLTRGKPDRSKPNASARPAHPRSRGENGHSCAPPGSH